MTDAELNAVRERIATQYRVGGFWDACRDADALLAEVDRLRAENAAMRAVIARLRNEAEDDEAAFCPLCGRRVSRFGWSGADDRSTRQPHDPDCPFVWYGENADD